MRERERVKKEDDWLFIGSPRHHYRATKRPHNYSNAASMKILVGDV